MSWVLVFWVMSSPRFNAPMQLQAIYGFQNERSCKAAGAQLVDQIRKEVPRDEFAPNVPATFICSKVENANR